MVASADQGTVSGQAKARRATSLMLEVRVRCNKVKYSRVKLLFSCFYFCDVK